MNTRRIRAELMRSMTAEDGDTDGPRHLLVRASAGTPPLHTTYDVPGHPTDYVDGFPRSLPVDDPCLGLSDRLTGEVAAWLRARPQGGFAPGREQRRHARDGLAIAQSIAAQLGPRWMVHYWDETHGTPKVVCWGCRRLHWYLNETGMPPRPVHITVESEFGHHPLQAEGFPDFTPDDLAASLHFSDDLVADLYQWAKDLDAGLELYLKDRDEDSDDARRPELHRRGAALAERVARESGPARTVTYRGLAWSRSHRQPVLRERAGASPPRAVPIRPSSTS